MWQDLKIFLILLDCFLVYSWHMHENPWATTEDFTAHNWEKYAYFL